jgi:F-type H+-transporting ATPase subunit gamma
MPSLKQIRGRLRSVQNTKQIMRAMQLVSASKLKRAQGRLLQMREVLEFLDGLLQRVLTAEAASSTRAPRPRGRRAAARCLDHPLCARRDGAPSTLVIFTSDAGLCGAYNANLIQLAEAHLRRDSLKRTQLIFIGKKGHRYLTKRGYAAHEAHLDLAGRPDAAKAEAIGRGLLERFLSGRTGAVSLLYSHFASSAVYRPTVLDWLPVRLQPAAQGDKGRGAGGGGSASQEYILEPSPRRIFEDLLPRWALATFVRVMFEAFTSEHSARMIAMKNATDNAEELIGELTRQRNKVRQASITKEISEIVGTAEALK